ncbi:hypothetical protein GCM10010399_37100 [Dactylosporangium fulvum]|uniref:serine hydrolase domain-containing protein n=1 Tax=Dactylosporangium fulvum TaxID=53359 RepID=UPI0031DF3539
MRVVVLVTGTLLAGAVALLVRPRPPHLAGPVTGDPALAADLRRAVGDPDGHRALAVAAIDPSGVRFAGIGDRGDGGPVTQDTPFEIGSVTKGLTGMLLADRIPAGTDAPGDPLRAALPAVSGPVGDVTLAELASHRAGLPSVPPGFGSYLGSIRGADPYAGQDLDWLLRAVGGTSPGGTRGTMHYSNIGAALLGQALAAKAGVSYEQLLRERVLTPIGMTATTITPDGAALPAGHASGSTAAGRRTDAWQGSGWAPAGVGVWSTAADLARLVVALRDGTAPGADAAEPRFDAGEQDRIGYGWFTTRFDNMTLTWHNGGTGGFRAYVGLDRASGRGVVVLGNTDRSVTALGQRLLGATPTTGEPGPDGLGALRGPLAVVLAFAGALGLLATVFLAAHGRSDRVRLASSAVWSLVLLFAAYRVGDWLTAPGWLWSAGATVTALALCLAALRWHSLPLVAGRPWWRWTAAAVSAACAALAAWAVA